MVAVYRTRVTAQRVTIDGLLGAAWARRLDESLRSTVGELAGWRLEEKVEREMICFWKLCVLTRRLVVD